MLGNPHLMLADIAGGDEVIAGLFRQLLQQRRREHAGAGRVVIEGEFLHPVSAGLAPAGNIQLAGLESGQRIGDIATDRNIGPAQLADLGRIAIDMDDARIGGKCVGLAGGAVVKARTDADQEIAFLHRQIGGAGAMHAQHAQEVG